MTYKMQNIISFRNCNNGIYMKGKSCVLCSKGLTLVYNRPRMTLFAFISNFVSSPCNMNVNLFISIHFSL